MKTNKFILSFLIFASLLSASAQAKAIAKNSGDLSMKPFFDSNFIFDTIPGYPSCHASTIAELPNGTLVASWYAGEHEKASDVAIFFSSLPKGAKKWAAPRIIQKSEGHSQGNPVLFIDPAGKLWLFYVTMFGESWNDCLIFYRTSDDGGKTWGDEVVIRKDKSWMTKNKPIILKNGAWLLPIYNETMFTPAYLRSDDSGKTWTLLGRNLRVPGGAIQPTVIQRADGKIVALLRTGSRAGHIWEMISADNAKIWSPPREIDLPNPNSGIDMVRLINGHVVLTFNDSPYDRTPLDLAVSTDEARTWKVKRKIENTFGEFSYPVIIQTRDGLIHVAYTWKRQRIKHVVVNEQWILEGDKFRTHTVEDVP